MIKDTSTSVKKKKLLAGKVISDKMEKTIVVEMQRMCTHQTFHKIIKTNKCYKVHDERNEAKMGDKVEFYEGRPLAKTKYMYLSRIVETSNA